MVLFLLILLMLFPFQASGQETPSVVINELAWMGTPVEGIEENQHWRYEWLELYGKQAVNLEGWNVELYRGEELYFQIPLSGSIDGEGYVLVAASDKIPGVDVNYTNLGGKFVNTGMKVILKDNLGNAVDEIDAQDGWPAGDNESKRTMERTETGWQTSSAIGGTPKTKNSEGLKELLAKDLSFANKKDPIGSFSKQSLFNLPVGLALLLALGSGAGILGLRRLLSRPT